MLRLNKIPLIVSLTMFMEGVDSTAINTAIPSMAHSLAVSPIDLKIALISYLLSVAFFIPISGWVADKYGIKRVFIIALLVFIVSSVLCGMAQNLTQLVIARILQGAGGSITLPVGRLIIVRTYQRHELVSVMNQVIIIAALGVLLGPTLGGLVTEYLSWRWIFFINIPVGLFCVVLAILYLPHMPSNAVHRLDKIGFFLFGFALATLTFGLSAFSESNISKWHTELCILISILSFVGYWLHSRKQLYPIVNTQLFLFRTFRVSTMGNLFSRLGFGGMPFLLPLLLQLGFGYSPKVSGLLLAPIALGVILVKPITLRLLRLLGYKKCLILNTMVLGMTMMLSGFIVISTPLYVIAFYTFIFGCLTTLQYSAMNSIAYSEIDQSQLSAATSVMSTLQQMAQSFGVAIGAIFLRFYSGSGPLSVPALHNTILTMGIMTILSVIVFLQMKAEDGAPLLAQKTN